VTVGRITDARPYGRNYAIVEIKPHADNVSGFHVRVPFSGVSDLAKTYVVEAQVRDHLLSSGGA
jgi:hypothetical protein